MKRVFNKNVFAEKEKKIIIENNSAKKALNGI